MMIKVGIVYLVASIVVLILNIRDYYRHRWLTLKPFEVLAPPLGIFGGIVMILFDKMV